MWDRRRIVLSFMLVALIALLAYGVIVYVATMFSLQENSIDVALSQWQVFQRSLNYLTTELLAAATDAASRPELRAFAAGGTLDPAFDVAVVGASGSYGPTLVLVLDGQGRAAYSAGVDPALLSALAAGRVAQLAGAGQPASGIYEIAGTPLMLAAAPLRAGDTSAGALLVGRPIDSGLMEQLKALSGRDMRLVRDGRLVASSSAARSPEAPAAFACPAGPASASEPALQVVRLPGAITLAATRLYDSAGTEIGCLGLDIATSAGPSIGTAVTIASLVALLLGLIAAYIISRLLGTRMAAAGSDLAGRERHNARLYAEAQQATRQLEKLVGERTSQLKATASQLEQAQTELSQEDRQCAVGSLTPGLVRELNGRLTTVLELLHEALGADAAAGESLERARAATLEARALLERVRSYNRRPGRPAQMVDLNGLVGETAELLRYELRDANVVLEVDLEDDPTKLLAERAGLQHLLLQLFNRAAAGLEHTPRPRTLKVATGRVDGRVCLWMSEPGTDDGVPSGCRLSEWPAGDAALVACRAIAEAHGGRMSLGMREGLPGSFVLVELPTGSERLPAGETDQARSDGSTGSAGA